MNSSHFKPWYTKTCCQLFLLFMVSFCIKMALVPAYFSTDHDVHQNWLRITACKPISQWYFDVIETESKWTLDYPPLFAYFELALSYFSKLISSTIASSINQQEVTVYYQRFTVIFSEIPYLLVLFWIFKEINAKLVVAYFVLPLILLDNIHFQYNIIMQAIFLLSIELIRRKEFIKGAFCYSVLLNFKHLYLYSSLAFFVYILKEYVLSQNQISQKFKRLAIIGMATLFPFFVSFLPFVIVGGFQQLGQIFNRLFPFQRGLIHDYWAPNFWALYYFMDKVANVVASKLGTKMININAVGELHKLRILPDVAPLLTTLIIVAVSLPLLISYFRGKKIRFQWLVFLCGCIFFAFGFHVHQKAITPYICMLLVFLSSEEEKNSLLDCSVFVNIVSLLPLLINPNQKLLRICFPLLWVSIWERRKQIENLLELIIITVGFALIFFHQVLHPLLFKGRMQFLPLMLNSLFCAAFNMGWISKLYANQLQQKNNEEYDPLPSKMGQEQTFE